MQSRRALTLRALLLVLCLGLARTAVAQDSSTGPKLSAPEIHGFIELYYRAGDPLTTDGYRLRKADLKFSGFASPHLRWRVGLDASKALSLSTESSVIADSVALRGASVDQKSRIVQDAALTYVFNPNVNVDIGQQLLPLSLEGTISTSQVETIERTMFIVERSRAVGLGDVRDVGVSANGFAANGGVEYHAGVFNETGESQGTTDTNDQKALMGRLVFHPSFAPGLEFGGSGGFQGGPTDTRRERLGGEFQYRTSFYTLRAEAMGARDAALRRFGWYGLGVIRPTHELQLVARYDSWDKDLSSESSLNDAYERQIVLGGSYLLEGGIARFVANVVRQDFPNVSDVGNGTFLLVGFEASF
ncbi:MAG TPA: porin [Gemmatimonadaceae bacterium]|nr:porin [Gemmatimonadaceae bacterium]